MKVLLDTNIIIHREASFVDNKEIGTLFYWLDKLNHEKCIHPLTLGEIKRYDDEKVTNTFKIKLESYVILKTEAPLTPLISNLSQEMDNSPNDINDTRLLNEVVNRWRTLVLPIMPPSSVSFHAFPHIPQGSRSRVKHAFVYDYRTSQHN